MIIVNLSRLQTELENTYPCLFIQSSSELNDGLWHIRKPSGIMLRCDSDGFSFSGGREKKSVIEIWRNKMVACGPLGLDLSEAPGTKLGLNFLLA